MTILLDQAVFSGSSFFLTILLARILEMKSFGQYSGYVLVLYLLVSAIGAFVIQPFQVLLALEKETKQYSSFAVWFQMSLILGILALAVVFRLIFKVDFPVMLLGFGAGFLVHDFGRRMLLALDLPFQTLVLDSATSVLTLVSVYVFSVQSSHSVDALLMFLSFPYLATLILLIAFLKPFNVERSLIKSYLQNHWREGKWLFFTAISQWWSGNLFVVASGMYLGAAALGALRLAQSLMGILNVLLQTFENYVLPQTAQRMNVHLSDGLSFLVNISKKAGFLFLPVLLTTFIFAEQLMVLAGGKAYASYAFALQGMSVLYVLIFLSQPIRMMIRALLLNDHFFYGYLISLAFALLFAHSLLSKYNLCGAIIGLGISQVLLMAYWTIVLQKKKIYLWKSFMSF